ncbi:hypothetical protein BDV59DRAFT_201409 [Aspergillus ambiguus]|uniref:uncharacterized protein n=1 Tax=Aspergillus ambiguus TaxID=176160 RepID=UPI003CCE08A4
MPPPKKVAIIGAGPSGLVTAKTLLHSFPEGTFAPVIFDKQRHIGGLWPIDDHAPTDNAFIHPQMRTNLSRFTVSFSDLAWESVIDGPAVPTFPRACQVGRYLVKYTELYLSRADLRLGQEVVQAARQTDDGPVRWDVQWGETRGTSNNLQSESFDYLVVASGYFATPCTPDIPGLDDFPHRTIHSSALHTAEDIDQFLASRVPRSGNIVVIGASMSGVETASALALHLSSRRHSPKPNTTSSHDYEVHHICSRPFWTVPYFVPAPSTFLPLDLSFYDLDRRPPGPVEYGFGPLSGAQAAKTNDYFRSLLGRDYEGIGSVGVQSTNNPAERVAPSWVAVEDDYAEYIRRGAIKTTVGRASRIYRDGRPRIDITRNDGTVVALDNVAAIVLATGFTPDASLAFLPTEVLSRLEYAPADPALPLVLDGMGTSHADLPELGFVGFYRGPYWGVMEMQARSLARTWVRAGAECGIVMSEETQERKRRERLTVRELRRADPRFASAQFPMGDYVGLMEAFARDLGIERAPLAGGCGSRGPVVPARYTAGGGVERGTGPGLSQAGLTMAALRTALAPTAGHGSSAVAAAVFRALHGAWRFSRVNVDGGVHTGQMTFYPRYPSTGCEKEYVCEGVEDGRKTRCAYQLRGSRIILSPLGLELPFSEVSAEEGRGNLVCSSRAGDYEYLFHFNGVVVSSWECTLSSTCGRTRAVYAR